MRQILVIAFHFPPYASGSGYQRTLKFCEYLPELQWEPLVLTARAAAYAGSDLHYPDKSRVDRICVQRAFALDARHHLSIYHKYPSILALPDRWSSWWLHGVVRGLRIIRARRPAAMFSTHPIPTAHLIALTLNRLTGLPWIADFRDPMIKSDWPVEPSIRRTWQWIERKTIRRCAKAVFTTARARDECAERHASIPSAKFVTIANGYDDADFEVTEHSLPESGKTVPPYLLVHSGSLDADFRSPVTFFQALRELKGNGELSPQTLKIVLRASGSESYYRGLLREYALEDIVSLEPEVSREEAVKEMLAADGLLLIQGAAVNQQIPAKLYEYFRARRPILGLIGPDGETAKLLESAGVHTVADLGSAAAVKRAIRDFLVALGEGTAPIASEERIASCTRRAKTEQLAALLDAVCSP